MIIVASHFGDVTIVNKVWSMHMSRFSVKKPMTVFVAVIIVIALGIVSLIKMTPDLLPSIDLPYVVVMTT